MSSILEYRPRYTENSSLVDMSSPGISSDQLRNDTKMNFEYENNLNR